MCHLQVYTTGREAAGFMDGFYHRLLCRLFNTLDTELFVGCISYLPNLKIRKFLWSIYHRDLESEAQVGSVFCYFQLEYVEHCV